MGPPYNINGVFLLECVGCDAGCGIGSLSEARAIGFVFIEKEISFDRNQLLYTHVGWCKDCKYSDDASPLFGTKEVQTELFA
mgnify:CR=1 FL=1